MSQKCTATPPRVGVDLAAALEELLAPAASWAPVSARTPPFAVVSMATVTAPPEYCDPSTCWSGPGCPREGTPCGGGVVGTGLCEESSLCCSEYGYCGSSSEYCDAATCYSSPDNSCTRKAAVSSTSSAPTSTPASSPPAAVSDEMLVDTAQLIVEIEPLMQDILDALDEDPTNPELLDALRDLSIRTWSSESGLQLAATFDASDTLDPTYVRLRESAKAALPLLCERADMGVTLFSVAAADCICGRNLNPSTYCAAVAGREILDYIAADANRSSRRSNRHLGMCKVEKPDEPTASQELELADLKKLYELVTTGGAEEFCLNAECGILLPPPVNFNQE